MEDTKKLIQEAEQAFITADHLCTITLPFLKETKLMIPIIQGLETAINKSIEALLTFEHTHTSMKELPATPEEQLSLFQHTIMPAYKIPKDLLKTIKNVKTIIKQHQQSTVEFARKENYFLCDKNYKMKILNSQELKNFLFTTRPLINLVRGLPC